MIYQTLLRYGGVTLSDTDDHHCLIAFARYLEYAFNFSHLWLWVENITPDFQLSAAAIHSIHKAKSGLPNQPDTLYCTPEHGRWGLKVAMRRQRVDGQDALVITLTDEEV
jgi:hypothetical protein